jgi:polysaccharide export outer membrane protein
MRKNSRFWAVLALLLAFAGTAHAAANDFTIQAGDVLQITVWKEDGLDREVLVLPDGTITFPLVGTIKVQDLSPGTLQLAIKDKLQSAIPDASVTVAVKAPLGHKVNVLGQVQKPGEVLMSTRMSVMQALSQAGGLTPYAKESGILIIRQTKDGKKSIEYPYDDISRGRDLDKDIDLMPGDVVFVPTAGLL